ncbi:hypothetical protein G4B88_026094 [Cannabis sativa]|uniref:Plastid lipid-associated protein/fibrillin conserved domain-containing protein n=1 Tax=Cannabis sativa TaxID=3483 RepID=A0A7J6DYC0_CANSA|nr:hypothetical protein G4B88_026094 [Cannabis sativa]
MISIIHHQTQHQQQPFFSLFFQVLCKSNLISMASASSFALLPSKFGGVSEIPRSNFFEFRPNLTSSHHPRFRQSKTLRVSASVSAPNLELRTGPDDLVSSILSKVTESDRGVLLKKEEHMNVAEVAQELQKYCVNEPVKCPLIFGEMIQGIESPDIVKNLVTFSFFGFLEGEVSLKGKLIALDEEWVQVIFEPPELKVGALEFRYGGESEVKLRITYVDDKIRLGKGSKGSLFVFQRRNTSV